MNKLSLTAHLLLLGCASPATQVNMSEGDVEPTVWVEYPRVLACAPSSLKYGEKLVLTLGPKHGKELAIRNEKTGVWYFLVVGSPPADMKSLMTPEQFTVAQSAIIPSDATGYAWVMNRGNEPLFHEPGRYKV